MFVVSRFDVPPEEAAEFEERALAALEALAARPGYRAGRVGRGLDDPEVWTLLTVWDGVGAYRRALSAYDVKVRAAPLLGLSRDEASAFETLLSSDGGQAVARDSDRTSGARGSGNRGAPDR